MGSGIVAATGTWSGPRDPHRPGTAVAESGRYQLSGTDRCDGGLPGVRRRFRVGGSTHRGDAAIPTDETRINDRIRARQVRLIGSDGTQYGVKPLPEALQIAREQG